MSLGLKKNYHYRTDKAEDSVKLRKSAIYKGIGHNFVSL